MPIAGDQQAPSTLALIRSLFADPRQRTTAGGVWISSFSAGGAVAAAGQLPEPLGRALLGAARQAFIHGLHLAFVLSAAAAIGAAILAAVVLRGVCPSSRPAERPDLGPGRPGPADGGVEHTFGTT
jgi:sugar phosphate permease